MMGRGAATIVVGVVAVGGCVGGRGSFEFEQATPNEHRMSTDHTGRQGVDIEAIAPSE
jgi:hypothetical protein